MPPAATPTATAGPVPRYTRGGVAFDAPERLSLSYPASFDGPEWVRFVDLEVLMVDSTGESYLRFISEFDRQLYAYPETASGTFVLSVHDGTLSASGRELEAEPLRRLLEGSLNNPASLETIQANLTNLIGLTIEFAQQDRVGRFTVVQAKRMSANDVAEYQFKPMELSTFMDPIAHPETSFLLLFCSGRQPDEPRRPFPGRYVLVLQDVAGALAAAGLMEPTP
ncbi:MAG: hypothetical protein R6X16_09615 [Anaerolineae bacterium]